MRIKLAAMMAGLAILAAGAIVGADALGVFASGGGTSTKAEVRLTVIDTTNNALASGKAKSEQRSDRTRFGIEVEDVQTAPGAYQVRVTRAGSPVPDSAGLTITVDALGFGDLNLDSRDGDIVPVVVDGDLVEVLDPAGATVILSGTMAPKQ